MYGFAPEGLLTACAHTADHSSNIAVGKLEAHEYLNALKAGELHDSNYHKLDLLFPFLKIHPLI